MKLLFILRQTPYGNLLAKESLDAVLASSVFEPELSILFMDDGVLQLTNTQSPPPGQQKNLQKMIAAFALYDIDRVFVCEQSLRKRGLSHQHISMGTMINNEKILQLMAEQDHLFSF